MRFWPILKFPAKLISFYALARQSSFKGFKNKWEVWRILTILTIKRAFEKTVKNQNAIKYLDTRCTVMIIQTYYICSLIFS